MKLFLLKRFRYLSLILVAFGLLGSSPRLWASNPISAFTKESQAPIQIHGGLVEYFHEEQKAVGTGGVSIDYEGVNLKADKITVYTQTKRAIAEGHVILTQKGSVFKGDRAEYDFTNKKGNVSALDGTVEPSYYGKAKTLERMSENHYRLVDSYVTTCCGDSPFYRIQAHEIDVYPDEKVVVRNAVMYIKQIPVLFIPYYEQYLIDYARLPVQVMVGKRHEWGTFILSKWRYSAVHNQDLDVRGNVLADYREKRGLGIGDETYYSGPKVGRGAFRYYYASDDMPPDGVNSNRSRTQWRHQMKIGEATTFTAEVNKLSDATVVKDFFYREEYERDAFPDNYISIITAKPEYTLSFLERERLDDFFSVVSRSPEIRFDTHERQFEETPFYLRQEVQFSNLRKQYANSDVSTDVIRLDTNHTMYYAGKIGAWSVTPRLGTRQTLYSRESETSRSVLRGTFDPGIEIQTRYYKTYDVYLKKYGFDYNQIRHIFTPNINYSYRPTPTVSRTLLGQFDSVDAIDKQNFVRFSFENKFQTREHDADGNLFPREIARIIPYVDSDLHTGHLENMGFRAEMRPYSWMGIDAEVKWDLHSRNVDTENFDIYFDQGPWRVSIGQRYARSFSNQLTAEIRYLIDDQWEFKMYERYEFEEGISREFEFTVSKFWSCVITDFTFNHKQEGGDTFYFAMRLKAFPDMSFKLSQSYDRPKASSASENSRII